MGILRNTLGKIFEISTCQNESLEFVVTKLGSDHIWWTREVHSDKRDEVNKFFEILCNSLLIPGKDEVRWSTNKGSYSTRDCYSQLQGMCTNDRNWNKVWRLNIPPKVQMFIWKFRHKIIPTSVFLLVRIPNMDIEIRYGWCEGGNETLKHLFFQCQLAHWTWDFIKKWWKVSVVPRSHEDFWLVMSTHFKGTALKKAWEMIIAAGLWSIWLARNEKVFQKANMSKQSFIQVLLFQLGFGEWLVRERPVSNMVNTSSKSTVGQ